MRSRLADKYAQVRSVITDIFHGNYGCYGYWRIDGTLRREGVRISEKVVRRLMSEQGLVVKKPRRRRFTAYAGDPSPAVENLIDRNFHAATPNTEWLTDLTEIPIPAGWNDDFQDMANLYSLVETCRANSIEPYRYLTWLFTQLPLANTVDDYGGCCPETSQCICADLIGHTGPCSSAAEYTHLAAKRRVY